MTVPLPALSPLRDADREVILGMRPTSLTAANGDGRPELDVVPTIVEDLGDERFVIFEVDAPRVDTESTRAAVDAASADDALLVPLDRAIFTARLPSGTPVTVGEPLRLAIDPQRLHFFDPQTGASLG